MFNFEVLIKGRSVKKYYDKNGSIWIEGRQGTAFTLKVKNIDYNRVLGIVSVDGLNVIDGKHVPVEDSRGYVINSYSNVNIPGWKINKEEVKEFYFTIDEEDSYARKIGADERNIGVIAAAVYKEKIYSTCSYATTTNTNYPFRWENGTPIDSSRTVYCSGSIGNEIVNVFSSSVTTAGMDNSSFSVNSESGSIREKSFGSSEKLKKVSVGSGEKIDFRTKTVDFERGDYDGEILIYYDSWEGLKRRGILRDDRDYRDKPQPFGSGRFCPDV